MKTTCKKSWPMNLTSENVCLLLTTEVVPKIFPILIVVAHSVIPAGWGSCLPRLAVFHYLYYNKRKRRIIICCTRYPLDCVNIISAN